LNASQVLALERGGCNRKYAAFVILNMPAVFARRVELQPYIVDTLSTFIDLLVDCQTVWSIIRHNIDNIWDFIMPKRSPADPKAEALRQRASLNPHPERVIDKLFLEHDFFDARDLLQVKYEMVRRVEAERLSVTSAATTFGFSRLFFYHAQAALKQQGLPGLLPKKRGPQSGHKLTEKVVDFLDRVRAEDDSIRSRELADRVKKHFGIQVHPRSIERALMRRKKKRL
jgi:transposase